MEDRVDLVIDEEGTVVGVATKWNPHGIGECIVQYFDGSSDSAIFSELEFRHGSDKAREYLNSLEQ